MPTIGDYSEVSICNLALTEIGRSGQIVTLDDPSTSARACKQRYPYARDACLRAYDWNFAAARAELAKDPVAPPFEYDAAWNLPDDCLLVRSVWQNEGCKWKIEKRQLLINSLDTVFITYTTLIDDPTEFDPLFVAALAARIAAEICVAVTESTSRAQGLWQIYNSKLQEARKRDAQEGQPDRFPEGGWVESRLY